MTISRKHSIRIRRSGQRDRQVEYFRFIARRVVSSYPWRFFTATVIQLPLRYLGVYLIKPPSHTFLSVTCLAVYLINGQIVSLSPSFSLPLSFSLFGYNLIVPFNSRYLEHCYCCHYHRHVYET